MSAEVYPVSEAAVDGIDYYLAATFKTKTKNYPNVLLNLKGRHQFENAAAAIAIAEVLGESGFKISTDAVITGLESAEHRGRLEFYRGILFDGAHNIAGAKALRAYLDEFVRQPVTMIFGAVRDKDLKEIAEILFPKTERLIFTRADNPRSLDAEELKKFLPADFNADKVFTAKSVSDAVKLAGKLCEKKGQICVTGSLYLVGEAQKILREKTGMNV